jgi:hypothetical protein
MAFAPAVFAAPPVHDKVKALFAARDIAINCSHVHKRLIPKLNAQPMQRLRAM